MFERNFPALVDPVDRTLRGGYQWRSEGLWVHPGGTVRGAYMDGSGQFLRVRLDALHGPFHGSRVSSDVRQSQGFNPDIVKRPDKLMHPSFDIVVGQILQRSACH